MKKKIWSTPKLVVLVRGKPAETCVVFCCKQSGSGTGPDLSDQGCNSTDAILVRGLVACIACDEVECS